MGKLTDHIAFTGDAVSLSDIIIERAREKMDDAATERAARENRDVANKADIIAAAREVGLGQFVDPED